MRFGITAILASLLVPATFDAPARAAEEAKPTIARTGDWRAAVRQFAEANLKHPAWGASHSMRDYELARELAAADHVTLDDDVLYAAAWLHDVAAFPAFRKEGVDHQDEAARIIDSLLADTGFPMSKIDAVRGAIRTHMYPRDPAGPEALYLHDADALDWLGAVGVARIFGIVDPAGGAPTGPDAVARLEKQLREVPPRILSKAGQARTAQRVRELEDFLKTLRAQTSNLGSL
jgi:HD superfamily phosphodiesterase